VDEIFKSLLVFIIEDTRAASHLLTDFFFFFIKSFYNFVIVLINS